MFITQQVGSDNDRELVKMVLPEAEKPFPHYNLREQKAGFVDAGFEILQADVVLFSDLFLRRRRLRLVCKDYRMGVSGIFCRRLL
jgi:hypothetical protein